MVLPGDGSDASQNTREPLRAAAAAPESSVATLESRLSTYESFFLRSPLAAIIYASQTLNVLDANEGALELLGGSREDLIGTSLPNLITSTGPYQREECLRRLSHQEGVLAPLALRADHQVEIPVRVSTLSLYLQGSSEIRLAFLQRYTATDAEDAARSSEERYRELFENANDIIFLHDLSGKFIAVNRAAEALTGYSRSEILGEDFGILLDPESRTQMQDTIRAHLGGSPTQHYELPIMSKAGVQRFLEVSTRVIYERGHPVAVQGIGRDITERKLSEQKLRESSDELRIKNEELSKALQLAREATQLKEQFLANTSHELRTPMNGIMGMTNLLRDTPLAEDQLEYIDAVSQCANDLLRMINDLLDVSQIEAGRLSIATERFDLRESFGAVVKMLRLKASGKGLQLTCDIEPEVPNEITGDSLRFRQILMNLIANAIKFTPSGGVRVCAGLASGGDSLLCRIVDTGIGVEESVRDRIFEAFFQADGTLRRRYGGTGLGLTISKQLVELLGGRIGTYNNQPGPGATFWFELPLRSKPETLELVESRLK